MWVDRQGRAERISEQRDNFEQVRLSPDGRYLAFETDRLRIDVWTHDLKRGTTTRLTSEALFNTEPVWSADGQWITYKSDFGSPGAGVPALRLVWRPADGTSSPQFHSTGEMASAVDPTPWSWSPDGEILGFDVFNPRTRRDIWILRRSTQKVEPLLTGPFAESVPAFSPDSRWLAYVSDESGRLEVYIRSFPSLGGRSQISINGGRLPRWAKASGELFYREGHKMMVVDVRTSPEFSVSRPRMLFENDRMLNSYDVTADGRRFVMIDTSNNPKPTQIDVIVNWFEELKRKVPVR